MIHKMKDAKKRNKMDLTIIYSDHKKYRNLGLNIKQIEENKELLVNILKINKL
jgi:ACT domain-containing protein